MSLFLSRLARQISPSHGPIEDVMSITGRGTVVTGRVDRGKNQPFNTQVEVVGL